MFGLDIYWRSTRHWRVYLFVLCYFHLNEYQDAVGRLSNFDRRSLPIVVK